MSSATPRLPKFKKTQDFRGFVSWECNFCGWKNRQPQYPKSHSCNAWKGRTTRSGRSGYETTSRVETEDVPDQRNSHEETSESDSREVPSPYNIEPTSYTPVVYPPNITQIDVRELMKQQIQMQQQMFQQQENFKVFMENQQQQFLLTIQKQQETFASKDAVVKEVLEDSKKKDENTNALLEMMKTQSLNSKRIPCPKWSKDESYKSFSARLKHWNKHYKSKGKYLELLESLQET